MGWSGAQEADSALQGQSPAARGETGSALLALACPSTAALLGPSCPPSSSSSLNLHVCATGRENPWMAGCIQNLLLGAAVYFV